MNILRTLFWSAAKRKVSKGKTGSVVAAVAALLGGLFGFLSQEYGIQVPDGLQLELAQSLVAFAISIGVFGVRDAQDGPQ